MQEKIELEDYRREFVMQTMSRTYRDHKSDMTTKIKETAERDDAELEIARIRLHSTPPPQ